MVPFSTVSNPVGGGSVSVSPPVQGGRVPNGSLLKVRAAPATGYEFTNWAGLGYFAVHGSVNPVQVAVNEANLNSIASFTQGVVTTITSIPAELRVV